MKKEKSIGMLTAYFYEILIAAALIPILALLGAIILSRLSDPMGAVGGASLGVLLLSAALAGAAAPRIRGEGWVLTSFSVALTLCALIAALSAVTADGVSAGRVLLSSLTYISVFIGAAALSRKRPKRRRKKR
jgi:hypothetical protein